MSAALNKNQLKIINMPKNTFWGRKFCFTVPQVYISTYKTIHFNMCSSLYVNKKLLKISNMPGTLVP